MTGWWLVSYLVLWALLLLTILVLLVVLRQLGLIYTRQEHATDTRPPSPQAGDRIGPLEIHDALTGTKVIVPYAEQPPTLMVLASADCSICKIALRDLGALASRRDVRVLVVSSGAAEANSGLRDAIGHRAVLISNDALAARLNVPVLPWAAVVTSDGSVLEARPVGRRADLERMLRGAGIDEPESTFAVQHQEVG